MNYTYLHKRTPQAALDDSYDEMTDFLHQSGSSTCHRLRPLETALSRAHFAVREAQRDEGRRPGELSDDEIDVPLDLLYTEPEDDDVIDASPALNHYLPHRPPLPISERWHTNAPTSFLAKVGKPETLAYASYSALVRSGLPLGQSGGTTTKVGPDGLADDLVSARTGRWTDLDLGRLLQWDVSAQGWIGESDAQTGLPSGVSAGPAEAPEAQEAPSEVDGDEAQARTNGHTGAPPQTRPEEEREYHPASYDVEEEYTDVTSDTASPVALRTEDHWR